MQIISFNFDKIKAEKKNPIKGKLEINSNINIKSINQEKLEMIKDQAAIKFEFVFVVDYKPNIAEISLEGSTILLADKDKGKEILKKWKNKKVPEDVRLPLFNVILTKSNLKALQLEEELNLPSHIPMPKLKPQEANKRTYAG